MDDDEVNRRVGAALLEQLGASVTVAHDGAEAVELAGSARFDLVLMDRQMPVLDGVAATRALRRDPRTANLPVVALTGGGAQERQECLEAGMDACLTKPVTSAELSELLARLPHPRSAG